VFLCGEISPIGNQKKGVDYDLEKGLFSEKFPQNHHILRGTKKLKSLYLDHRFLHVVTM
jgi:hypothetical protein